MTPAPEAVRRLLEQRRQQGLPPTIKDPVALSSIASAVAAPAERRAA